MATFLPTRPYLIIWPQLSRRIRSGFSGLAIIGGGRIEPVTASSRSQGGLCVGIVVLFVVVGLSQDVFAYVDLGSGSYMLQLMTAGLFGGLFAARSLWARVVERYRGRRGR